MMVVLQTDRSRCWCIVICISRFSRRGTCFTVEEPYSQAMTSVLAFSR
ncbi:hypothetical protein AVEN_118208-1, partial [Araneus ventricosus]